MKRSKKPVALLTMCLLMLNTVSAFAADGDIWVKASKTKLGAAEEIVLDDNKLGDILLSPEEYLYEKGGKVYEMTDLNNEFKSDKKNYLDNLTKNNTGAPLPSVTVVEISKVEAINRTTIGVEFSKKLSAELNNAKLKELFSVEGLIINDIIPSEDRMSAEIITEAQAPGKSYDVKYDKKSAGSIVAPDYFAEIKLSVDKTDVVIVPSSPTPETVKVTAELDKYFPKNSVVTLEFDAPYGTINREGIVKKGEKLELIYKPSETKNAHVHTITAKVKNVKGPEGETAGADYENYANAKINPVSINVTIASEIEDIKSYLLNVAYTDEADRVVLKTGKDQVIDERLQSILKFSPAELRKEDAKNALLYTQIHNVLYSKIDKAVDDALAKAKAEAEPSNAKTVAHVESELKAALKLANGTDISPEMLRDVLIALDKGCVRSKAIDELYENGTLAGVLNYYKLLKKFVVFDNVREIQFPKMPEYVYVPEFVYQNSQDTIVIVLPGRRVNSSDEVKPAAYLMDNATHQVHLVGNDVKDRYLLLGSPTFRLEDARFLRLKRVSARMNLEGGDNEDCCGLHWENKASVPGAQTCKPPKYEDTDIGKALAKADLYETPKTVHSTAGMKKSGEILVQFSESVLAYNMSTDKAATDNRRSKADSDPLWNNSVLNPRNWVIDGYNLGTDVDHVEIQLVSSDESKELRDAVKISIDYAGATGESDFVKKLVEKSVNQNHIIQVNTIGDWAGATDRVNIVTTQEDQYEGKDVAAVNDVFKADYQGNIFVVMAAAQPDTTQLLDAKYQIGVEKDNTPGETRDLVHVLFSEPVDPSMRDAKAYALNGHELPAQGTEIVKGLRGVTTSDLDPGSKYLEHLECAVTIILPDGYLQDKQTPHILTIKGMRGLDDTLVQGSYAAQMPYAKKPVTYDGVNGTFEEHDEAVTIDNVYELTKVKGGCGVGATGVASLVAGPAKTDGEILADAEAANGALKAAIDKWASDKTDENLEEAKEKLAAAEKAVNALDKIKDKDANAAQIKNIKDEFLKQKNRLPKEPAELLADAEKAVKAAEDAVAAYEADNTKLADARTAVKAAQEAIDKLADTEPKKAGLQAKLDAAKAKLPAVVENMTATATKAGFGITVNVTAVTDPTIVKYKVFKADETKPAMSNFKAINEKTTAFFANIDKEKELLFIGYDATDKEVARQLVDIKE